MMEMLLMRKASLSTLLEFVCFLWSSKGAPEHQKVVQSYNYLHPNSDNPPWTDIACKLASHPPFPDQEIVGLMILFQQSSDTNYLVTVLIE